MVFIMVFLDAIENNFQNGFRQKTHLEAVCLTRLNKVGEKCNFQTPTLFKHLSSHDYSVEITDNARTYRCELATPKLNFDWKNVLILSPIAEMRTGNPSAMLFNDLIFKWKALGIVNVCVEKILV